MSVLFNDAKVRRRYYFPGHKQWGIVQKIIGQKKRTGVIVKLDKRATDILIRPQHWVASNDEQDSPSAPIPAIAPIAASEKQVVGLKNAKVLTRTTKPRKRVRGHVRTINQEATVEDTRPAPNIPGPPVPKPIHGVWDKLSTICMRDV